MEKLELKPGLSFFMEGKVVFQFISRNEDGTSCMKNLEDGSYVNVEEERISSMQLLPPVEL